MTHILILKRREYNRNFYLLNRDKILKQRRDAYKKNPIKKRLKNAKWKKENPELVLLYQRYRYSKKRNEKIRKCWENNEVYDKRFYNGKYKNNNFGFIQWLKGGNV